MVLQCFHLNEGTGGDGVWRGGEGVVREMLFRQPLTLSVLTERRNYCPFGLNGVCVCVRACVRVCVCMSARIMDPEHTYVVLYLAN